MGETKLLFVGNRGAGKTTAIATVSEVMGLDYGELTLAGKKLRLYATSDQSRNSYFMKGTFRGLVVLVNNAGSDPIGDLARCVDMFRELISKMDTVIGITHLDIAPEPPLQSYDDYLKEQHIHLPVFAIDARSRSSVITLIEQFQ